MFKVKIKNLATRIVWFFFLAFLGFSFIHSSGTFRNSEVDKIEYKVLPFKEGEVLITEGEIEKMFEKKFIQNKGVASELKAFSLSEIRDYFVSEPLIKRADVYIDIHQTMHIDIVQRVPFLRVILNSGKSFLMDEEGISFPLSNNYSPRLIAVTGFLPLYQQDLLSQESYKYKEVIQLAKWIQEDEFWKSTIEQIHVDEFGEFVLVPKMGPRKIILGGIENSQGKLEKLKIFYREALPDLGWNTYHSLNIKFNRQVIGVKK